MSKACKYGIIGGSVAFVIVGIMIMASGTVTHDYYSGVAPTDKINAALYEAYEDTGEFIPIDGRSVEVNGFTKFENQMIPKGYDFPYGENTTKDLILQSLLLILVSTIVCGGIGGIMGSIMGSHD